MIWLLLLAAISSAGLQAAAFPRPYHFSSFPHSHVAASTPARTPTPTPAAAPVPIPLTSPHIELSSPSLNTIVQLPVYVPVEQSTGVIPAAVAHPAATAQLPVPVIGPSHAVVPAQPHAAAAAAVALPYQPPPPPPQSLPPSPSPHQPNLLAHIEGIPELGLFSLYLSLPLFENITQGILNQTSNPPGVADKITVFAPSNLGVLKFGRRLIEAQGVLTTLKNQDSTCSSFEFSRLNHLKDMYSALENWSNGFNNNTRNRGGNLQQHQALLQTFKPQYHDMFNKANFTQEEQAFMRANLLYHIGNSSIHLFSIPQLSFPSSLMNDTRFVLLNSPTHPTPIVPQRMKMVKREEWPGQPTVELRFGAPGSGYWKSRVYNEPHLHNILAANGILHVIDRVQVMPLNISATLWLADLVSALDLLNTTSLLPRINVTPNITIFIPSEEAFAYAYGYNQIKNNKTLLEHVIQHHIAAGIHDTTDLNTPLLTYNNDTITPHRIGIDSYLIEDANIIVPNILFKNGIIHIIDKVLTTPALLGQPPEQILYPHHPSMPFPLIPPFQARPEPITPTNMSCPAGDAVCHIVNVITNQTSPYPTCFNPSTHVCVSGSFLCPIIAPAACGVSCYNISTHECHTVFADGRLHYYLIPRTAAPPPERKPVAPTPTCPPGDQVCYIMDIRTSTTEARPQCYNPMTHVCSNNTFLCPLTQASVCGFMCYDAAFYSCAYSFVNHSNSFQWHLEPTPLLLSLSSSGTGTGTGTTPTTTAPVPPHATRPTPTTAPTATPLPLQPIMHPQPPQKPYQPQPTHQPQPQPQPLPTHQPQPHQPTPQPQPQHQPQPQQPQPTHQPQPQQPQPQPHQPGPHPQPQPYIPPQAHEPTAAPRQANVACPAGTAVCHVQAMEAKHADHTTTTHAVHTAQTAHAQAHIPSSTPVCYDIHLYVCLNGTFLCPIQAPVVCGEKGKESCYNATEFECVNNSLKARPQQPQQQPQHQPQLQQPTHKPQPTPTPTHSPVHPIPPPNVTCPAGTAVCHVQAVEAKHAQHTHAAHATHTAHVQPHIQSSTPVCYDPKVYVCLNDTFLCPVQAAFLCSTVCYNATELECVHGQLKAKQPHQQPQPQSQPQPQQPTPPHPQPQPQPQPQPHPQQPQQPHQPTTPTQHPVAEPTCPAGNAVCHVKSPFVAAPAHAPIATCYNPHTHVCANGTFLCPVNAPLLCDAHCYNATVFECVHDTLRLHAPNVQPRLSPHVAAHVQPRALSLSITTATHLPSRVDLSTTRTATTGTAPHTHATHPSPVTIEMPSGGTVSLPAGARVSLVGEAQVATILEALMTLPPQVRDTLSPAPAPAPAPASAPLH